MQGAMPPTAALISRATRQILPGSWVSATAQILHVADPFWLLELFYRPLYTVRLNRSTLVSGVLFWSSSTEFGEFMGEIPNFNVHHLRGVLRRVFFSGQPIHRRQESNTAIGVLGHPHWHT